MENKIKKLQEIIENSSPQDWDDISKILLNLKNQNKAKVDKTNLTKTAAFFTFDYGIDGVSIEISKYAQALENIAQKNDQQIDLHFISGDFYDKADAVLKPEWNRFEIENINGWSKWDDGKWFSKLFYEDMPENSDVSKEVAQQIWQQATSIAQKLADYLAKNNISLIVPVNISSNPGNIATTLGFTLAPATVSDISIIALVFGLIGARIFSILFESLDSYLANPILFLKFWQGGLVWYGGLILVTIGIILYIKLKKLDLLNTLDFFSPLVSIGLAFGRAGCLFAGCCHGTPTDLPWGVKYRAIGGFRPQVISSHPEFLNTYLHPTQHFSALAAFAIFLFLSFYQKKKKFAGEIVCLFFILYSIFRFLIEFLRGDDLRGYFFNNTLATSQLIAIFTFLTALGFYVFLFLKNKKNTL